MDAVLQHIAIGCGITVTFGRTGDQWAVETTKGDEWLFDSQQEAIDKFYNVVKENA